MSQYVSQELVNQSASQLISWSVSQSWVRESMCCCYLLRVQDVYASANSQVHTLRRMVREKDQTIRRQSRLERQAQEVQQAGGPGAPQPQRGEGDGGVADSASPSPPPCANLSPR